MVFLFRHRFSSSYPLLPSGRQDISSIGRLTDSGPQRLLSEALISIVTSRLRCRVNQRKWSPSPPCSTRCSLLLLLPLPPPPLPSALPCPPTMLLWSWHQTMYPRARPGPVASPPSTTTVALAHRRSDHPICFHRRGTPTATRPRRARPRPSPPAPLARPSCVAPSATRPPSPSRTLRSCPSSRVGTSNRPSTARPSPPTRGTSRTTRRRRGSGRRPAARASKVS